MAYEKTSPATCYEKLPAELRALRANFHELRSELRAGLEALRADLQQLQQAYEPCQIFEWI